MKQNAARRPIDLQHARRDHQVSILTLATWLSTYLQARKVEIMKANHVGVAPYGAVSAIVSKMKPTLPWFNVKMLRSHLKKLNKQKSKQPAECGTNISCCRACRSRHHQQR
jgi:hypothetical protein